MSVAGGDGADTMEHRGELNVLCCTANIGNTLFTDISGWVPKNGATPDSVQKGGFYDLIAVGMQECVFGVSDEEVTELAGEGYGANYDDDDLLDEKPVTAPESATAASHATPRAPSPSPKSTKSQGGWGSMLMDKLDNRCTGHIDGVFQEHLGSDYVLVAQVRKMQMRLRVYAHTSVVVPKESIETSFCNTGLNMGVVRVANKGGQIIKLTACKQSTATSFCFVNTHLAAHEGRAEERDSSIRAIMDGVGIGRRQVDFSFQSCYSFWMGDMNYRTDLAPLEPDLFKGDDAKERHAAVWQRVHGLTEDMAGEDAVKAAAARTILWNADELLRGSIGMDDPDLDAPVTMNRVALHGWKTLRPMYKPTFKVVRETPHDYVEKRIPSYTDKVLWTNLAGFEDRIRPHDYASVPEFKSSDHKPVRCGFTIIPTLLPRGQETPPFALCAPDEDAMIKVAAFDLSCGDIVRDVESRDIPDPLLKFYCTLQGALEEYKVKGKKKNFLASLHKSAQKAVKHLAGSSSTPQTTWKKNDVNPVWKDEIKLMKVMLSPDLPITVLGDLHILVACLDHDDGSADDRLGTVVIRLGDIFAKPGEVFEVKDALMRNNGKVIGTFSGKFVAFHPSFTKKQNGPFNDKIATVPAK